MEILNLDEVVTPSRSITWQGIKHTVQPTTVEGFIKSVRAIKELEKSEDGTDVARQMELSIDAITTTVPTLTAEIIRGMTLEQMGKINRFLRGEYDKKAMESVAESQSDTPKGDEKKAQS